MNRQPEREAISAEQDARHFHRVMGSNRFVQREYRQLARRVIPTDGPVPTAILDIGTGPGYVAIEIARLTGSRAKVTGIDLSEAMLRLAEENARVASVAQHTEWRLADAAAKPFADASFDLVVSSGSLHHWADPAAILTEVDRVLRPDGRAYIRDSKRVQTLGERAFASLIGLAVPRAFRHHYWGSIRSSYTPEEARSFLAEAGLSLWRVEADMLDLVILRAR